MASKPVPSPLKPVLRLTFDECTFDVVKLMASELSKINLWTGFCSKKEWVSALGREDIEAFKAGFLLMAQRAGDMELRFSNVDFDTDEMSVNWVHPTSGRFINPVPVLEKDGTPKLDHEGDVLIEKDEHGNVVWVFADDGEKVPPTAEA